MTVFPEEPMPIPMPMPIHPGPPPPPAQSSEPFSFEAKIAMALQGAKWQELQNATGQPVPTPLASTPDEIAFDDVENVEEANKRPELTEKQKQKKKKFDAKISRDAGDVLQTIESASIVPVDQDVTWDGEPELLCSYNWQDASDTNTIFGKHLLSCAMKRQKYAVKSDKS
jgi:hypothetical protein